MKKLARGTAPSLLLLVLAASCHGGPPPATPGKGDPPPVQTPPGRDALGASPTGSPRVGFAVAEEAPLSLTASDGSGLKLAALKADAVVDGPLAFTELHLTFENPDPRTREGTFRITLPPGASIARFAMKIGETWQEGEVVELTAARHAYEDFLHRKQDPALMEKSAGNEFSARVFPIPANGKKEIAVAYSTELGDRPYTLPLRGLPSVGEIAVRANVAGAPRQPAPLALRDTTPTTDFVVEVPAETKTQGVAGDGVAILRVQPDATSRPEPIGSAIVLVDTSASRALGFESEIALVDKLVKRIAAGNGSVVVACFDQNVAPVFEGRASQFGAVETTRIRERGALGASDLEHALEWARAQAKKGGQKRLVLVSDGVATAGKIEAKDLAAEASRLKDSGIERIDAVAVGGIRDDAALAKLVRGTVAHDGVVVQADTPRAFERLGEATRSNVAVKVDGAKWFWPKRLDGVQAGDTYSIYVETSDGQTPRVALDGRSFAQAPLRKGTSPRLVERAVLQAKVGTLESKKEIVDLAVKNRLVTAQTAMLVLETEADYARFHIDRKSPADLLAIKGDKVERVHRTIGPLAPDTNKQPEAEEVAKNDEGFGYSFANDPSATTPRQPRPSNPQPAAPTMRPPADAPKPAPMEPMAKKASEAPGSLGGAASGAVAPRRSAPVAPAPEAAPPPPPATEMRRALESSDDSIHYLALGDDKDAGKVAPYEGRFADVMTRIAKDKREGLGAARAWRAEAPGDVLALVALGEAAEKNEVPELAARAYGSIVDLFPNRADLRRLAGERLERLGDVGLALASDTFAKAAKDRPDHPSSHRLLAYSLLKEKQYEKAFAAIAIGAKRPYEADRFNGVERILAEDVGLIGAAWIKAEPQRRSEILAKITAAGGKLENEPSLRFVLNWETDANDVDFHIHDAKGGHAYYGDKDLPSGGSLYADVTTGYGPECFTIRGKRTAAPYTLEAHYYSRGPMGYGMGKLEIIEHDGKGGLKIEERPFIVMQDGAFVALGTVP